MASTTNFGFQEIAGALPLQPGGGGIKDAAGVLNQTTTAVGGYNDLLEAVDGGLIRRVHKTFSYDDGTELVVPIAAADDYGSALLFEFGVSNYLYLGFAAEFVIVKDGTGIVATAEPTVAIGELKANNAIITGTRASIVDTFTLADVATVDWKPNMIHNASPAIKFIAPAVANLPGRMWFNASTAVTVPGSLTVTGEVTAWVLDVGGPVPEFVNPVAED